MSFCFPGYDDKGADLPPRRECAPFWRQRVISAMPQIELVLVIGKLVAMRRPKHAEEAATTS